MTMKNNTNINKVKGSLPKKLEKVWVTYMVDLSAGPTLMLLGMRFPDKAEKLQQILVRYCNDAYAKDIDKWRKNPQAFVKTCWTGVDEMIGVFLLHQLTTTLTEGMPKAPLVIKPKGPFRGN